MSHNSQTHFMGYTRIVQYGNIIEVYEYAKNRNNPTRRIIPSWIKKRNKATRELLKAKGVYQRSKRNIQRCVNQFFKVCHENNCSAKTIAFVTLTFAYDTTFKASQRSIARFMEKVRDHFTEISVSYISVPELTKKGRWHYHLLVYNLPTETILTERQTRNLQRQFERGYIDICHATYTSEGIAGYMAKYMAKSLYDGRYENPRGYNCSRNIKKIRSMGSNSLTTYLDMIVDNSIDNIQEISYDVPYLGLCKKTRYIK